jgi:hypothetical protein
LGKRSVLKAVNKSIGGPATYFIQGTLNISSWSSSSRQFDSSTIGKLFECFTEVQSIHSHQKTESIAAYIAYPAPECLSFWINLEARSSVFVPRAEADKILSASTKGNVAAGEVNNISRFSNPLFGIVIMRGTT